MCKIPENYFTDNDTLWLARDLIGKKLITKNQNSEITAGIITETEAYLGVNDLASHASGNRYTNRTATMYRKGGIAYVYLCYGIHYLFNIVTQKENTPHAILIRGILATQGIHTMIQRTGKSSIGLIDGPGKLTKAMGISMVQNGQSLTGATIWLQMGDIRISRSEILTTPRIGVDYAGEDAQLPYRFLLSPVGIGRLKKLY